LRYARTNIFQYHLEDDFLPPKNLPLSAGDWIVINAYFGLFSYSVRRALDLWPSDRLIVDAGQSLFLPPTSAAATIYSPRKFVGVGDGGFLYCNTGLPAPPEQIDVGSVKRLTPVLGRLDVGPEQYYEIAQEVEKDLGDITPKRMSNLTTRLLNTIDWDQIARRRRLNFERLNRYLTPYVSLCELGEDVPLCFPVRVANANEVRAEFLKRRIYSQRYWRGLESDQLGSFERSLFDETVYIPCDQRYGDDEMTFIAEIFHSVCRRG
jgi:hypothetical protein